MEIQDPLVLGRLAVKVGLITVIAFLVALAYRPVGWTVFIGLLVFQVVLMAALAKPLSRVVRVHS